MKSLVVGRVPETATDSPLADKRTVCSISLFAKGSIIATSAVVINPQL